MQFCILPDGPPDTASIILHPVALTGAIAAGVAACLGLAALLLDLHSRRLYRQKTLLGELFEQAPLAVALTTIGDRVLRINRHFTALFGYTRQAALGRRLSELIVPAGAEAEHAARAAAVTQGQRVDVEGVCARQDGSHFPAAITMVPFSAPGQDNAVYAIYRDLTRRRQAENAHQTFERRWQVIFDNTRVGLSLTDPNGKFIATNRAYQEITGYSEEELHGLSYLDLTVEEDRPASAAEAANHWNGGRNHFELEKRYRRKDGRIIWVKITVAKGSVSQPEQEFGFAIVEDITARKHAETRLLEYERIVENLQEMVVLISRDYRYVIANQSYLNHMGLRRDEVIGRRLAELVGQERFDAVIKDKIDQCFAGRRVNGDGQFCFPVLGRRDLRVSYFPTEGPAGVECVATVLTDITDQKSSALELQRSLEQLHALNAQLETVREVERTKLSRDLHDQLGQSLTAIRLQLSALTKNPFHSQWPVRAREILEQIDATIDTVRHISTDLRPSLLDDLGLDAAVEWAAEDFQSRTGIVCRATVPRSPLKIHPHRATAVFRILQESLTNVLRHAHATFVAIILSEFADHVLLEVRDNGCGITREQIKSPTTLGIMGMRERAVQCGGDFSIGNTGAGTLVRVGIPLSQASNEWPQ